MKALAIALPLLIAATVGQPAQARDLDRLNLGGNLVLSFGTFEQGNRQFTEVRYENRKRYKKRRANPMPPRKIARILKKRGFYNLRKMRTDGRVYIVKARGRKGNLVRLTVNARNGKIINRKVLRRMQRVDRWQYDRRHNQPRFADWRNDYPRYPFWMR